MRSRVPFARGLFLAGLTVLGALGGAGCDLFATREPPPVEEGTEGIWQTPTTPRIVVENLERALEAPSFGDYQRALTEDFVFRPDDADVVRIGLERPGETPYENWDREVERQTAEAISQSADSVALTLELFEETPIAAARLIKYRYDLTLFSAGTGTTFEGEAWFQIRQEPNGDWLIFDWEDVASSNTQSWGLLKGRSRPTSPGGGSLGPESLPGPAAPMTEADR
ncbi:MAG: hypothetical protein ACT4PE_02240 [Candidatus Eiseniibacteriota bacterium]